MKKKEEHDLIRFLETGKTLNELRATFGIRVFDQINRLMMENKVFWDRECGVYRVSSQ
ncbi:hypothetical protein ACSSZE_12450 [Acidithiobacillus caldus]